MCSGDNEYTANKNAGMHSSTKPKLEFSKKLIIGASFFYSLICAIALLLWLTQGECPKDFLEFFSWPLVAIITSYMGKSAYENKPKIQNERDKIS